jgi:transcriptional regulator with XRE-family HTH domain
MGTTSERIKEALELRGMKQSDLVEKTGIGKSSISTYISGAYEPKQRNIYKIAKALDVNEAWLMGYDVPMGRETGSITFDDTPDDTPFNRALEKIDKRIPLSEDEKTALKEGLSKALKSVPNIFKNLSNDIEDTFKLRLMSYYDSLNSPGKAEALKRVEELTYIPKYTNEDDPILNAAHAIEGATEEEKQHDDDLMNNDEFWK